MVVLDDVLTDNDTYLAFEEALGAPAVLHLVGSDDALAMRAADAVKDADDSEVQPRLDAAKEALDAPSHFLNRDPPLPNVYKIDTPELGDLSKEQHLDNIVSTATQRLQPQVHIVIGPPVREVTAAIAAVLAQKAAGKQVVLDGKELASPNPRYPSELNAALESARACGETILPNVWAQIFEQRLPEYPLQHLFLVNYPSGSVEAFPTVRDELEVLSQYAVVKGVIVADFSEEALKKFCYKGLAKTPETADEAYKYFRGLAISDAKAYTSDAEARREYIDSLAMDRPKWLTRVMIEETTGSLPEAAREASKSVLAELELA
jgi:hypothetical protein